MNLKHDSLFVRRRALVTAAWMALLLMWIIGCIASTPNATEVSFASAVTAATETEARTLEPTPVVPSPTPAPPSPTTPPTAVLSPPTAPPAVSLTTPVEGPYEDRGDPVGLLASYYNAINRREYRRAWKYWGNPPNPSFEDFVQGYAETAFVFLVVSPPTRFEGAAGSVYVGIPTLLVATHLDGSQHAFVGCYVARRPNLEPDADEEWSLYSATVTATPGNSTDATLLMQACTTP